MINDTDNPYTGPTGRPSLDSARRRSARLHSREHNTSADLNNTPEKIYPSLESEDEDEYEYNRINSSGNDSFNKSKSTSTTKFIHEERQTITHRKYGDRTPEGRYYGQNRRPECAEISPPPLSKKTENVNKSNYWIAIPILIVIAVVVLMWFVSRMASAKHECPQFKTLAKQYSHQDQRLWKSLKINIENVINQTPEQPSVFLLAYNDRETVERIVSDIINATAKCMHSTDPIRLNGGTFANAEMLKDYGVIIDAYRERLQNQRIMYVADLHETPAAAAQAFHTICDTITPFVHKSVIFFTLFVDEAQTSSQKQIHNLVEEKLSENWRTINRDTLDALIGRVTDQVFFVHSES